MLNVEGGTMFAQLKQRALLREENVYFLARLQSEMNRGTAIRLWTSFTKEFATFWSLGLMHRM